MKRPFRASWLASLLPAGYALLLLAVGVAAPGCAKADDSKDNAAAEKPAEKPDRSIAKPEAARGHMACKTWADRACACAESRPEVAPTCDEAKKIPEALHLAVRTANSEGLDDDVRVRVQHEARRIVARCIEETAKLPCP